GLIAPCRERTSSRPARPRTRMVTRAPASPLTGKAPEVPSGQDTEIVAGTGTSERTALPTALVVTVTPGSVEALTAQLGMAGAASAARGPPSTSAPSRARRVGGGSAALPPGVTSTSRRFSEAVAPVDPVWAEPPLLLPPPQLIRIKPLATTPTSRARTLHRRARCSSTAGLPLAVPIRWPVAPGTGGAGLGADGAEAVPGRSDGGLRSETPTESAHSEMSRRAAAAQRAVK